MFDPGNAGPAVAHRVGLLGKVNPDAHSAQLASGLLLTLRIGPDNVPPVRVCCLAHVVTIAPIPTDNASFSFASEGGVFAFVCRSLWFRPPKSQFSCPLLCAIAFAASRSARSLALLALEYWRSHSRLSNGGLLRGRPRGRFAGVVVVMRLPRLARNTRCEPRRPRHARQRV